MCNAISRTALAATLALGAVAALGPARAALQTTASFSVLHTMSLPGQAVSGIQMQELSGLAWDADEQVLYAVSDRGVVFHLQLNLGAQRIDGLVPVFAARLRDPRNQGRKFDAEGLAVMNANNGVKGDTQLVIALETGPTVVRFTPRGEAIGDVDLPPALGATRQYRSKNKRLEAIAVHPKHGFVMAPEVALAGEPTTRHTLYATSGAKWSFDALKSGSDIKAIETLPDGTLLVLERLGPSQRAQAALRRIDPASCGENRICAIGDAPAGTASLIEGNFEGMTRLSDTLYLLVSDGAIERKDAASFVLISLPARRAAHLGVKFVHPRAHATDAFQSRVSVISATRMPTQPEKPFDAHVPR